MALGKGLVGQHLIEEVDGDDDPVELNDDDHVPHDEDKLSMQAGVEHRHRPMASP